MMRVMPSPRPAGPDDLDTVASVLADAFTDDPLMEWAFPDDAARPRLLHAMFTLLAEHRYLPMGDSVVDTAGAASLWQPPSPEGGGDDAFWEHHGGDFAAALDGQVERIATIGVAMADHHPPEPHWYLLAVGTQPAVQGRGLGGALLGHTLARVDEAREIAYLEASSPRSRALYERHGFEVTGELTVEDSPPVWPMVRPAR